MSFPRQDSVTSRLQAINLRALNRKADAYHGELKVLWRRAARLLKADIAAAYEASSPRGGRWDLTSLQAGGTLRSLSMRAGAVLEDFKKRAMWKAKAGVTDIKKESARRHRWVIEQVTPAPKGGQLTPASSARSMPESSRHTMHEADVPLPSGFDQRWGEWVDGYHEALIRNLKMGALNGSNVTDAMAEVDATRVSTPAYTLEAALDRLWGYYAWEAVAGGMHQSFDESDDVEEEIWRVSGDLRVCDDCDANNGLPIDEADGTIPLHPNCNCFPQLVPKSYAALLRSGDEADRELAADMDAEGVAPNAMVVRGANGDIKGRAVVDFDEWEAAQGRAVAGGI